MTTLLEEFSGQLTITTVDASGVADAALQSAAEIVERGESLIVVDGAGCFEPGRMTHSARLGALDPAGLVKHLQILRAKSAAEIEDIILHRLPLACERAGTRNVLIADLLSKLYDPAIPTRDASRILGRVKAKLEEMAQDCRILVLLRETRTDLGTRSHFLSSLSAAAGRVYFRNNTYTAPPPPSQTRAEV
jgi:hypothetical protein